MTRSSAQAITFVFAAIALVGIEGRALAETQFDMDQTAYKEAMRSDRKLNVVYNRLLKRAVPATAARLRTAEKAWLVYRDAQADYDSSPETGGSIRPMIYSNCIKDETDERIDRLKAGPIAFKHSAGAVSMPNVRANAKFAAADGHLNAIYKGLLKAWSASSPDDGGYPTIKQLQTAERAWIAYRDAEAAYEAGPELGTRCYTTAYDTVLTGLTIERTNWLKGGPQELDGSKGY